MLQHHRPQPEQSSTSISSRNPQGPGTRCCVFVINSPAHSHHPRPNPLPGPSTLRGCRSQSGFHSSPAPFPFPFPLWDRESIPSRAGNETRGSPLRCGGTKEESAAAGAGNPVGFWAPSPRPPLGHPAPEPHTPGRPLFSLCFLPGGSHAVSTHSRGPQGVWAYTRNTGSPLYPAVRGGLGKERAT